MTRNIAHQTRKKLWIFTVILTLCSSTALAACSNSDSPIGQDSITSIADKVVNHAISHDGYVGGWLNTENGQHSVFILSSSTEVPIVKVKPILEIE